MSNNPWLHGVTGTCAFSAVQVKPVTEKEKVELWFIDPLLKMSGDDAFICLIVCFPLLETIIRHDHRIPDHEPVILSDHSPALRWFARFMTIPESTSREVWDAMRNGLLHRAMIKGTLAYDLTGRSPKRRPAEHIAGTTVLYVWDFRDKLVAELKQRHRKLWNGARGTELPGIYVRS